MTSITYHVTTAVRLPKIIAGGLLSNQKATVKGWYEAYSRGKVFFVEAEAVKWWADRIEEHLFHSYDDPPDVVVVRFPKSVMAQLAIKSDEVGAKDSRHPSFYTEQPIVPPQDAEETPGAM